MIFSKVFKSNPVQSFELSINSGVEDNAIAFGPASIINGNVKLFLDKPVKAKSIKVSFKCEEWNQKKDTSVLFSVESSVWQTNNSDQELEAGSHMYLFAIQLPSSVNYPPTIKESYLGHRIEYSLQAHIDFWDSNIKEKSTSHVVITYLPLVTYNYQMNRQAQSMKNSIQIRKGSETIDITASLVNPSSCPGDLCSIKLYTQNHSSHSINQVHVLLLATATSLQSKQHPPDLPTSGPSYQRKLHQLLNQVFYVSIPKRATNHTSICPLTIPASCVPTTQVHSGHYLDISYEIFIVVPSIDNTSIDFSLPQLLLNPQVIRLPLFITTVPYSLPVLEIPFADDHTDLPVFLTSNESPISSPMNSDWGSASPSMELAESFNEDNSGHLMVPPIRRTLSNTSK